MRPEATRPAPPLHPSGAWRPPSSLISDSSPSTSTARCSSSRSSTPPASRSPAGFYWSWPAPCRSVLLAIDEDKIGELQKTNAGYTRLVIPKGTYAGQDADVATMGTVTHLVASAKLSEDLVAQIAQALVKHKDALAAVVKDIGKVTPKEMGRDIGLPFHPGARKFFAKLPS